MGPAKAGVSENKAWAQSSFVLGKLPLSRKLLSCRFPFNLQLLSRVWVRGEVDLADPSHETHCYHGQQWRTAARFRRDFCARSLLPAVSATSQSGKDLTLSILNWWAEQVYKELASDTRPFMQSAPGFHCPPPAAPPSQQGGVMWGSRLLWRRRLPHHYWWAQRDAEGSRSLGGSRTALSPALGGPCHTSEWRHRWGVWVFWSVTLSGSVDEQARPRPGHRVRDRVRVTIKFCCPNPAVL